MRSHLGRPDLWSVVAALELVALRPDELQQAMRIRLNMVHAVVASMLRAEAKEPGTVSSK